MWTSRQRERTEQNLKAERQEERCNAQLKTEIAVAPITQNAEAESKDADEAQTGQKVGRESAGREEVTTAAPRCSRCRKLTLHRKDWQLRLSDESFLFLILMRRYQQLNAAALGEDLTLRKEKAGTTDFDLS